MEREAAWWGGSCSPPCCLSFHCVTTSRPSPTFATYTEAGSGAETWKIVRKSVLPYLQQIFDGLDSEGSKLRRHFSRTWHPSLVSQTRIHFLTSKITSRCIGAALALERWNITIDWQLHAVARAEDVFEMPNTTIPKNAVCSALPYFYYRPF